MCILPGCAHYVQHIGLEEILGCIFGVGSFFDVYLCVVYKDNVRPERAYILREFLFCI